MNNSVNLRVCVSPNLITLSSIYIIGSDHTHLRPVVNFMIMVVGVMMTTTTTIHDDGVIESDDNDDYDDDD